jgi:serine/threonine-protein kinase
MRPDERELWRRADRAFAELIEKPAAERRGALAALGLEAELRSIVEELLAAAEGEGGPLDRPVDWAAVAPPRAVEEPRSLAGRRFGAWELDEELGRGGMAVVHRARRVDGAFEQEAAVKVLGVGLLATGAAERFRRERQVLAHLRHPNIATLYDGGVAEDGTPYLVMERIEGSPIDRWSSERRLGARERVALMVQVCEAVAFAHRNLVVHRDLKPSNILVDAEGRVKLLDFGIAKLLEVEGEGPEATRVQDRYLTPGFAAPEQADGRPVTTATDVYGLGKVLERLLAEEPPGGVDSDLRNIVGQALRAEPERRYADARAFGDDLGRWLAGRPVKATPDSSLYRLRKLVARRRAAVAAALAVAVVAAAGAAATIWQAERARREARTAAAVNAFLVDLFRASDPERAGGEDPRASELLERGAARARDQLGAQPLLQAELLHVIGRSQRQVGRHDAAAESLETAIRLRSERLPADDPSIARARVDLGFARFEQGNAEAAVESMREGVRALSKALPPGALERLRAEVDLADMLAAAGAPEEARRTIEALLERSWPEGAEARRLRLVAGRILAGAIAEMGDTERGAAEMAGVVEGLRALGDAEGARHDLALALNEYGVVLFNSGELEPAHVAYEEALALKRRVFGEVHTQVSATLMNMAIALQNLGRADDALAAFRRSLEIDRRIYGERHPEVAAALGGVAFSLHRSGQLEEARTLYAESVDIWRAVAEPGLQPLLADTTSNYGALLVDLDEPAAAEPVLREAVARYAELPSADPMRRAVAEARLGAALAGLGRAREAVTLLDRAMAELEPTFYGWKRAGFVAFQLAAARAHLALGDRERARAIVARVREHLDPAAQAWDWRRVAAGADELERRLDAAR